MEFLIWHWYGYTVRRTIPSRERDVGSFVLYSAGMVWLFSWGLIFILAFVEEGLWDITVWQEHSAIFGTRHMQNFSMDGALLTLVVPLLALPQITHYILDGFIWKIKKDDFKWNNELTPSVTSYQFSFDPEITGHTMAFVPLRMTLIVGVCLYPNFATRFK